MNSEFQFNIGDYVRVKDSSRTGNIVDINVCMDWQECKHTMYTIRGSYPDREPYVFYEFEESLEPSVIGDFKIAFLQRLQSLMSQYDAKICGGLSDTHNDDVIYVSIGDDDIAYRNGCGEEYANITPDNIMDFDEE